MLKMTFIYPDGKRQEVEVKAGQSILEIARENDVPIEGACDGSLSCATCHVIVEPAYYELLDPATEDEEDMLDLAIGVTKTSRLGCQVRMTDGLDGLVVTLPEETASFYSKS
ncbi:MAG: 2Fe-2S iron-sulfur cluster-binding protein [Alphaproteobacteria bacterium]